MFWGVVLLISALFFPACLINAITLNMKDDERAIRYTIWTCITFAATVFGFGFTLVYSL